VQRDSGNNQLPSDIEIQLFDTVLEVLETGFDVLTLNQGIFNEWQTIISSSTDTLQRAGKIAGASLALLTGSVIKVASSVPIAGAAVGTIAAESTGVAVGTLVAAELTSATAVGTAASTAATGLVTGSGAAATGVTVTSAMCSAAVLGPLALSVAGAGLYAINYHYHRKACKEQDRLKKRKSS
jgi:hypothetical protein